MEDRRSVGASSCNSGDGTDQRVQSLMFMMMMMMMTRLECKYLSNTTLLDGTDMYRIYYRKNNYMIRHLTMAIFRLRNEKTLVSSYTRHMWAVYSGEVRGEVGTRSRMCCVGLAVWVHGGFAIICYV